MPTERRSTSPYDDFAYLNYRSLVGILRNVGHDFLRVRTKARLEGLDGLAEDVAHADVGRRCAWSAARETLVDRVVLAAIAHQALYQRHVFVTVVLMVESRPGRIGVHHADFDHRSSPRFRFIQSSPGRS